MQISTLTPVGEMLIDRFVQEITGQIDIEYIYLFGSRAINSSIRIAEELDVNGELVLSPIIINESLLKNDIGIGKRIREEGILLWSKRSKKREEKGI